MRLPCHITDSAEATTTLKVPAMNIGSAVLIRAFDKVDCDLGFDDAYFPNGLQRFTFPDSFFRSESSINYVAMKSQICRSTESVNGSSYRFSNSANNKHVICTPDHLNTLATQIATYSAHEFILGKDLDFTNTDFTTPIGNNTNRFSGIFFGEGHYIKNIDANFTHPDYMGIFGFVGAGAEIEDLKLDNIKVAATSGTANTIGSLVGKVVGTTTRIKRITATNITVDVSGCTSGCSKIGGLIGLLYEGEIYDISMDGVFLTTNNFTHEVGGIIGRVEANGALRHSKISNLGFLHPTSNSSHSFGGAIGVLNGEAYDIKTSFEIDKDVRLFNVDEKLGGVIGTVGDNLARVNLLKAEGVINIENTFKVGGVIGSVTNSSSINDLISNVQINRAAGGGNDIGGVIGRLDTATDLNLSRLISYGDITDCPTGCGGVIGYVNDGGNDMIIDNAHSYGNVSSSIGDDIGGVIGKYESTSIVTILQNSHSEGDISGRTRVGGLIGTRTAVAGKGKVHTVYTLGDVTASQAAPVLGGLIGDAGTINGGNINEFYTQAYITSSSHGVGDASVQIDFGVYVQAGGAVVNDPTNTKCYYNSLTTVTSYITRSACVGLANESGNLASNYANLTLGNWTLKPGTSYPPVLKEHMPYMVLGDDRLGSEIDPYEISAIDQWNIIGDNADFMDQDFILVADLDFEGKTFVPIGDGSLGYTGQFRGNNHTIRNIDYTEDSNLPVGLFRKLGDTGTLKGARIEDSKEGEEEKKLFLENINFTGNGGANSLVGTLAGIAEDYSGAPGNEDELSIKRVHVIGGILNSSQAVGGLIGKVRYMNDESEISHLSSSSIIDTCAGQLAGGIFGTTEDMNGPPMAAGSLKFESLDFSGSINCNTSNFVGGIIGKIQHDSLTIEKVINSGEIVGNNYVGGIVGYSHGRIESGKNSGDITGFDSVGGLVGQIDSEGIHGSYSLGNIQANSTSAAKAGGLVGYCSACTLIASYANSSSVLDGAGAQGGSMFGGVFNTSATSFEHSFYIGPDDSNANGGGATKLASLDDIYDPSNTAILLGATGESPWIIEDGRAPLLIYEEFPIFFEN